MTELDFKQPADRVAIASYALRYNTPDQVASMMSTDKGREELSATWSVMPLADRGLYRRRASVLIEAMGNG